MGQKDDKITRNLGGEPGLSPVFPSGGFEEDDKIEETVYFRCSVRTDLPSPWSQRWIFARLLGRVPNPANDEPAQSRRNSTRPKTKRTVRPVRTTAKMFGICMAEPLGDFTTCRLKFNPVESRLELRRHSGGELTEHVVGLPELE